MAAKKIIAELDAQFPNKSEFVNREIAQILIYLRAPHVIEKCLKLMTEAKTQEDQIYYLYNLRTLPIGQWTMDQRKEYFSYFTKGPQEAAALGGAGAVVRGRRPALRRRGQLPQLHEELLQGSDRQPVGRRAARNWRRC